MASLDSGFGPSNDGQDGLHRRPLNSDRSQDSNSGVNNSKSISGPSTSSSSTSTTVPPSASSSSSTFNNSQQEASSANFECNICLDTAKDAVVSLCGHLFCWPCLHQWLETKQSSHRMGQGVCPVCKAAVSRDKVIPLYGRGQTSAQDPRNKQLPPRPSGQRTEPEPHLNSANFPGFGFGDGGFHMSFGIGAFPFGFFASSFNFGDAAAGGPRIPNFNPNENHPEDILMSKIFLWVALAFIFWLLLA